MMLTALAACGGGGASPATPAADFSIGVSTAAISVIRGATSSAVTVSVAAVNGFDGTVSVALAGLPAGATTTPAFPASVTAAAPLQFTITLSAGTPVGNSTLTLSGTSGSLNHAAPPITLSSTAAIQTSMVGSVLYLQSYSNGHAARIGLDTAWGGAIVEVSLDGVNFVNAHDTGREVQPALYDGADVYTADNCSPCIGTWGWNPVLGGDRYGHGSPVIASQLGAGSIYVKAQPLEWNPDDKGGGPDTPIGSDVYVEQTVSTIPAAPLGFLVHTVITHFGTDQHYDNLQEFPAVYVNSPYTALAYYGGTAAWTGAALSEDSTVTALPGTTGNLYSSELWDAYVDGTDTGLAVYVPSAYAYVAAFASLNGGGAGSSGNATNYFHQMTAFGFAPGGTFTGDYYLLPGNLAAARSGIYGLHQAAPVADVMAPYGVLEAPAANSTISGASVAVAGWAIDNVAVSGIQVLVDGNVIATPALTVNRPDVAAVYPNAALTCGWQATLDSTTLANGTHTLAVRYTDSSNNVASLPPETVTVAN